LRLEVEQHIRAVPDLFFSNPAGADLICKNITNVQAI